jgi:hypothetical protein
VTARRRCCEKGVRSISLIDNRSEIELAQLARIEAFAAMPHSAQAH